MGWGRSQGRWKEKETAGGGYGKGKEGYIEAINFLLNDVIGK